MPRMKLEEYLAMITEERIDMLLAHSNHPNDRDIFREAELAAENLPPDIKEKFEQCQKMLLDQQAQDIRQAYIGGLADGIRIAGCIHQIDMECQTELEKWRKEFCSEEF